MATLPRLTRRGTPRQYGNPNALSPEALSAAGISAADRQALTAAGIRIGHSDAPKLRNLLQPWQSRAFSYYDKLGEIKFASQFYSRMLSPLKLYAAELDSNGDWVETKNEVAIAALARIQDPGGGTADLLGSYGRLMFLVGEVYLLCTNDPETGLEQWEMLSTDELRIQGDVYTRYRAPSLMVEQLHEPSDDDWEPVGDDSAIAYRLWRRHPRYSALADSTMMGVLDLCEELLLLTRAVRARARSRLAGSGILAISEDFSYAPMEATPDEDVQSDPFLADLTAAMMLPIANEGTASAVVPLVVRGTTEAVKDGIRHIQIVDPTQLYPETGLRNECIDRIAVGLDMPPEILKGLGDNANHWTAWNIDEQTWKAHGMPVANQLVADLTASYFRPQLREEGIADAMSFAIRYDAADVVNHPDRSTDAKEAYDRRAIGKRAYRTVLNFNEDDAPSREELAEMVGVATRDSSLAWDGVPAPRGGNLETSPGVVTSPSGTGGVEEAGTGADVEPGPPTAGETPVTSVVGAAANGHADAETLGRILGGADLAILRAREAAGNRLLSLARRRPETKALLSEDVRARDVAHVLGQDEVRKLGITEVELVKAGSALIEDALRLWIRDREKVVLIAAQIERHAARTLYEAKPVPYPAQFRSYVSGVIAGK